MVKYFCYKLGIALTDITAWVLYLVSIVFLPFTKKVVTKILKESNIQVNGSHPSDPKIFDNRFYCLVAKYSYTGFVDAYKHGYFECDDLCGFYGKIYGSKYYNAMCFHPSLMWRSFFTRHFFTQLNAKNVGEAYDLGAWSLEAKEECKTLSTGYWKEPSTFEDPFKAKHDLIARKLKLEPGMRVLDIGCGEGAFCKYLAENHKVDVTGINISKASIEKAKKCSEGLKITYKVMDARNITGVYDRITCIGVIEHIGTSDLRKLFRTIRRCLTKDGIFLLEIYSMTHQFAPTNDGVSERVFKVFTDFHYFLDNLSAIDGLFVIEDCQNLGKHFTLTMKNWFDKVNLTSQNNSNITKREKEVIRSTKATYAEQYGFCYGGQARIYQLVLSKNGLKGGYDTTI